MAVGWSFDGKLIASASEDLTVRFWDSESGHFVFSIEMQSGPANCIAWSPVGRHIAVGTWDSISLWDLSQGQRIWQSDRSGSMWGINSLAWSPDAKSLVSADDNQNLILWNTTTGEMRWKSENHRAGINGLAWAPSGDFFASASDDETVRIWSVDQNHELAILEGHTAGVKCLSFSADSSLLASKGNDGISRVWRCDTWQPVGKLKERTSPSTSFTGLAFHPRDSVLAALGEGDTVIRLWDLNIKGLKAESAKTPPVCYTNAKIVLVGDSGVGKSGLSLVLSGYPWVETGSTHARKVWNFSYGETALPDGRKETREALIWDLAGQPNYRLIHQLHLNEVTVALVLFDSRSPTDPFVGVKHWDRALRQAQRSQTTALPFKKFLVAARIDVGRVGVSQTRIDALVKEMAFDGYFETSAKEGWGITELIDKLRNAVGWDRLPKVTSSELFRRIKDFLIAEKKQGRVLSTSEDLYRSFLQGDHVEERFENLRDQFDTCIRLVEARGLIRRLNFGNLVLLEPEKIDSYASAIVDAAKDEPDGMGSIAEETVLNGRFRIPRDERLADERQESLLLPATVAHLVQNELALREQTDEGPHLVFPSQLTREVPDLEHSEGKAVIFTFDGALLNVYATLVVRLSHSGFFVRKDMWKNATTFFARAGSACGISLREIDEGKGELTLFFEPLTSEETRFQFEEYIRTHLQRRAIPETILRRRIFVCDGCHTPVSDLVAGRRLERGLNWLECPVCDQKVWLRDREERLSSPITSVETEIDKAANVQREKDMAVVVLPGKELMKDFDVFLCHNNVDKVAVKGIASQLREHGILPWLDEWELRPGLPWQDALEQQISKIRSAAVFVSANGLGPWHHQELNAFLREFANRGCPVIPVLLPGAPTPLDLPVFLKGMTWVDFGRHIPDPVGQLVWGITGRRRE